MTFTEEGGTKTIEENQINLYLLSMLRAYLDSDILILTLVEVKSVMSKTIIIYT